MKEFDNIDELFQGTFDGFEVVPDASVKESIDKQLAQSKRKRRFFIWFFPIGIALGALTYFGISNYSGNNPTDKKIASSKAENKSSENKSIFENEIDEVDLSNNQSLKKEVRNHSPNDGELRQVTGQSTINKNQISDLSSDLYKSSTNFSNEKLNRNKSKTGENIDLKVNSTRLSEFRNVFPEKISSEIDSSNVLREEIKISNLNISRIKYDDFTNLSCIEKTGRASIGSTEKPNKNEQKQLWSVAGIVGFEGRKIKDKVPDSVYGPPNQQLEFATIRTQSYYGKIEFNRKLSGVYELIAGLGFRSQNVYQYGTKFAHQIPENFIPLTATFEYQKIEARNKYTVNSLIVPLGVTYRVDLGQKLAFRASLLSEFSFGSVLKRDQNSVFTIPTFNALAFQVGFRPELHYSLKKVNICAFGTINRSFRDHLTWDFVDKKPWLFGGGIGVRYWF